MILAGTYQSGSGGGACAVGSREYEGATLTPQRSHEPENPGCRSSSHDTRVEPGESQAIHVNWFVATALGVAVVTLFAWNVQRYAFVGDDAFISFRYARHLAEGHGLVFNPGERVEGYTNFLWVLMMAGFMRIGVSPELPSQLLGVLSGVLILVLLVRHTSRDSVLHDPFVWVAPLALAANRSFTAWSTGGLETQFFTLLILAGTLLLAREREGGARPWGSAALFAVAALTRPEGVLFAGIAGVVFAVDVFILKRRPLSAFLSWGLVFAIPVGLHFGWRLAYYGFPLPNTFYAKVSGVWLDQALDYLRFFAGVHQLKWCLPIGLLIWSVRRDFFSWLSTLFLVAWIAYMGWTGGDRFEFRFMVPILPFLFWLLAEAIRKGLSPWDSTRPWQVPRLVAATLLSLLVLWAAYRPNTIQHWSRDGIAPLESIHGYSTRRVEEGRFLRSLVEEGYLEGNELIAVGGAGALPYYSQMPVLDFRGLNDVTIAHQELLTRGEIAHEKSASLEYLTERGVVIYDVLNQIVQPVDAPEPKIRAVERDFYSGQVRCLEAKGRYLVFATTLSDAAFRDTFRNFRIVC